MRWVDFINTSTAAVTRPDLEAPASTPPPTFWTLVPAFVVSIELQGLKPADIKHVHRTHIYGKADVRGVGTSQEWPKPWNRSGGVLSRL